MRRNTVFNFVKREKHMKVLDGQWVFGRKMRLTGEVIRLERDSPGQLRRCLTQSQKVLKDKGEYVS